MNIKDALRRRQESEALNCLQAFFGAYYHWHKGGYERHDAFRKDDSMEWSLKQFINRYFGGSHTLQDECKHIFLQRLREVGLGFEDPFQDEIIMSNAQMELYRAYQMGKTRLDSKTVKEVRITFVISQLTQEQFVNSSENTFSGPRKERIDLMWMDDLIDYKTTPRRNKRW